MKKGFTLAEILITLGIIGIVAAMTVPTLMENTRNKEFQVRLKKAYSEWNQISRRFMDEHEQSIPGFAAENKDPQILLDELNKYSTGTGVQRISAKPYTQKFSLGGIKLANTNQPCDDTWNRRNYNMSGYFYQIDGLFSVPKNGPRLCIDLNGPDKKPNTLGIDIFSFIFTTDGTVIPEGQNHADNSISHWSVGGTKQASIDYCKPGTTAESTLTCAYYAINDKSPTGVGTYWKDYIGKKQYKQQQ